MNILDHVFYCMLFLLFLLVTSLRVCILITYAIWVKNDTLGKNGVAICNSKWERTLIKQFSVYLVIYLLPCACFAKFVYVPIIIISSIRLGLVDPNTVLPL